MRFEDKIAIVTGGGSGIGKEIAKRTPANNRAVMLIGKAARPILHQNSTRGVESIDDVVGKLVCAGCQGDGTSPIVQSHAGHPRKCPLCKGTGFFWSACDWRSTTQSA
jgi:NAD(P)-dependent dehydrogenase (short-subunit alcohol dehydrogenase family)